MTAAGKPDAPAVPTPRTLEELMIQALAMERGAVDRYTEFADALEMHNNQEVAQLFRTMAGYEAKHAAQIMKQMGWKELPELPRHSAYGPGHEDPETAPIDGVHYLMQPWHALQLALASERRAEAFFAVLARLATSEPVRKAALEMQAEEAEHVALIQAWIAKVPPPDKDWALDPDPPRYTD
jgi:rubrerythrin